MTKTTMLKRLAEEHGTPIFVVDHDVLRCNYRSFARLMPRVQVYYAVKANADPCIVRTLWEAGASFDVASMAEFEMVHDNIAHLPGRERQDFIWDKIIYANPIKDLRTLEYLDPYRPLVTYDNLEEIGKIARHAPRAGLVLRLRVPNTGSVVELSSKFGAPAAQAVELIAAASQAGLTVEGLCFHVGSQCTNFDNYVQALQIARAVMDEAESCGFQMKLVDIGGGFPVRYELNIRPLGELARIINAELKRLFPREIEILAEPGRAIVASAATLVTEVIGKAYRDGRPCYYINDGIYGTFSGILFDHCRYHLRSTRRSERTISAVFGPTCDALDVVSQSENLPDLGIGDLLFTENIGAYSHASATFFNGFAPARVVHVNV